MIKSFIKKIKRITLMLLILIIVASAFILGYKLKNPSKPAETALLNPDNNYEKITFELKESILQAAEEKRELIVLELELKERITLDESWGDLTVFKKLKNIEYYGLGSFAVSLDTLQENSIKVNPSLKLITIIVPKPFIKDCFIQEERTLYESTENGLLRFGEITLTPEDSSLLRQRVLARMKSSLDEDKFMQQATDSTRKALEKVFSAIALSSISDSYQVEIVFE